MCSKLVLYGSIILVLFVLHVQSTGHMGMHGPIIIGQGGRKRNDLLFVGGQTKCGHGPIISRSGRKRKNQQFFMIGGSTCMEKKKEVEIKHVVKPVPYPVKEYVPVPYKETVQVPVHIPIHVPVPMKEDYGMSMGGYGGGGGMDMGGYGGGYAKRR